MSNGSRAPQSASKEQGTFWGSFFSASPPSLLIENKAFPKQEPGPLPTFLRFCNSPGYFVLSDVVIQHNPGSGNFPDPCSFQEN